MKGNYYQIIGYIILITFFTSLIFLIVPSFEFQTYSPDSIRFLHFWQNSFSSFHLSVEDDVFKFKLFLLNIYDAFHASNFYDLGRGRVITYMIYGIENSLLLIFNSLPINFIIVAVIIINSHGASLLVSRSAIDYKFYIYALSFLIIGINSISLSPAMYFALYSKYICLTFILYFFVFKNPFLKSLMLFLAFFTDEISMFLGLIICFFYILQVCLSKLKTKNINPKLFIKNVLYSGLLCLSLLLTFFLIIFLIFDTTPLQFAKYAARGTLWLLDPENLLNKLTQIVWTLEIIVFGFSFESVFILQIVGILLLFALLIFTKLKFKNIKLFFNTENLSRYLINFQSYPNYSVFVFWILTTLLLLIVLPSSLLTYQTYSYPLMLSLAIVILLVASIKLSSLKFLKVLVLIAGIHLVMVPEMIENVNKSNQKHLLKDSSISPTDINNLQLAIDGIRTNKNYEIFQNINNFQEIDFSGKWYYSLEEHYRFPYETDENGNCIEQNNYFGNCILQNNYYPVYGSVRVLAWPHFQIEEAGQNKRKFAKNKPTYKD
mgnify:FL=1